MVRFKIGATAYLSKAVYTALVLTCLAFAPMSAKAGSQAVALTVDGNIAGGGPRDFTIGDLEALGTRTIKTETPWHDGVVTFEGVPLATLMEHVGAGGKVAYIVALNNYSTEIPLSDFASYGAILASRKNGDLMPVSDKGPLFVIYPYDSQPDLKTELYYSRSAWQVRQITVE